MFKIILMALDIIIIKIIKNVTERKKNSQVHKILNY